MNDIMANKVIGRYIEAARVQCGMTQSELAKSISVSRTLIVAIENGDRSCSMVQGIRIATALGVTMDQLLQNSLPSNGSFQSVVGIKDVLTFQKNIMEAFEKLRKSVF